MKGVRMGAACALLAVVPLAGCSGAGSSRPGPASSAPAPVLRWWSNSAAEAGSLLALGGSDPAVGKLHASDADYCGMVRQTVSAGTSILPGVAAGDPALLASTKAFLAELQKVAPAPVVEPWHVVGDALISLVASAGAARVTGIDAAAVRKGEGVIAADARHRCGIDLAVRAPAR